MSIIAPAPAAGSLRLKDAVQLPDGPDVPLEGRAARRDAYPIFVTRSLEGLLERLVDLLDGAHVALITDRGVQALHGEALLGGLCDAGVDVLVSAVPAGEASKSLESATRLWERLARSELARRDVVLTFGGGMVNDLGGWVASAYMRGLPYVNVPTTLLAQVDGALGGKVAVNHRVAKNLLGAFHNPIGVISNVAYLRTLDVRHTRAGLAESIKKAVIASPAYWRFIEEHADAILGHDLDALERLVRCATAIKTTLIERDPYEVDLRRPLNFGHTVGHPLETVTGYGLLHGEAVAFGMVVEARIALDRGLLAASTFERLVDLLRRVGLPTRASELPRSTRIRPLLQAMEKVRLIRAGSLRYVLPAAPGETVIADDVGVDEARAALRWAGLR